MLVVPNFFLHCTLYYFDLYEYFIEPYYVHNCIYLLVVNNINKSAQFQI